METDWLTYAKRLQAIASTGLHYSPEAFDRERFQEIGDIANEMLSKLGDPQVEVRGALVQDGKVLLVQEASDKRWTLPGGFADVGLTPSQNTAKEVWEEAGLKVRVTRLYAIKHKASHPYPPDTRDFYKFFFLCEQTCDGAPQSGHETQDVGFFSADALPPLSLGRVLEDDIHQALDAAKPGNQTVFFD